MTQGALVLEGGALRCLFTAGVLDIMLKQEIEMSCVMGVSAGSLSGVNYVAKQIGRTAKVNIHYMRDKRYFSAWNWLKQKGFLILISCSENCLKICCRWIIRPLSSPRSGLSQLPQNVRPANPVIMKKESVRIFIRRCGPAAVFR